MNVELINTKTGTLLNIAHNSPKRKSVYIEQVKPSGKKYTGTLLNIAHTSPKSISA